MADNSNATSASEASTRTHTNPETDSLAPANLAPTGTCSSAATSLGEGSSKTARRREEVLEQEGVEGEEAKEEATPPALEGLGVVAAVAGEKGEGIEIEKKRPVVAADAAWQPGLGPPLPFLLPPLPLLSQMTQRS